MPVIHSSAERARLASVERAKAGLASLTVKPLASHLTLPAVAGPRSPPLEEDFLAKLSAAEKRDSRKDASSRREAAAPTGTGSSIDESQRGPEPMAETDDMRHARENLEAQQQKLAEAAQELERQKTLVEDQRARAEQLNSELASAEAKKAKLQPKHQSPPPQPQPPAAATAMSSGSPARAAARPGSPRRAGPASRAASPRLDQLSKARKRPESPHGHKPPTAPAAPAAVQPSAKRPPSARAAPAGPGAAPAAEGGLELASKAPSELRKEILALRAQLEAQASAASRAEDEAKAAQAALVREREEREAERGAHEERFEDMTSFLEGLLKNLKAESVHLREQLAHEQQQRRRLEAQQSRDELDEFERLEASARVEGDEADAPECEEADTPECEEADAPEGEAADTPEGETDTPEATPRGADVEGPQTGPVELTRAIADEDELCFAEGNDDDDEEDDACPSPLKEARLSRFILLDDDEEEGTGERPPQP